MHPSCGSRGHRGVDDHVARDVEVRDPAIRVDHGDRGSRVVDPWIVSRIRLALLLGQPSIFPREVTETVVHVTPRASSVVAMGLSKTGLKKLRTAWPKMIGSETFIIVAFMCSEKRSPDSRASST